MYTENTVHLFCEHLVIAREKNPKAKSYINIYAGESTRIHLCRLCSTVALGVIVSARMQEAFDPEIEKKHDFV